MTDTTLSRTEASAALPQWRYLLGRLHLGVETGDFATGLDLVTAIAALADEHDHHPDIDLRYGRVHVSTVSHDVGGITVRDIALGRGIDRIVAERGLAISPVSVYGEFEIAIDALDIPRLIPFWQAVTGYDPDGDDALIDPDGRGPSIWFQQMDEPREQRNRIHLDLTLAHDEIERRLAAALAAGGTLVSDDAAPRFRILADAEGNEVCLCTWQGRDELAAAHTAG